MEQKVRIIKTDGNVGVAGAGDRIVAIIAPAKGGAFNLPTTLARAKDIRDTFLGGPLAQAGAWISKQTSQPVLLVRCDSAAGTYGTIAETSAGTSVITAGGTAPDDDFDVIVEILTGGTRGTAGITYRYSLDGGVTYSGEIALGLATSLALEGNVTLALAAGTLVTGNKITLRTAAGVPSATHLSDALEALRVTSQSWATLLVVMPATALIGSQVDTWLTALEGAGKFRKAILGARRRNAGETRAAYLAAMQTAFSSFSSIRLGIAYDAADYESPIDERWCARSPSIAVAARDSVIDIARDASARVDGAYAGLSIVDANGDPKHHDEYLYPGADDLKFLSLRTWPDLKGAFLANPRVFSQDGSDYQWMQHVNVLNEASTRAHATLSNRLSVGVLTDRKTGFILEEDALDVEGVVNAALRNAILNNGRASDAEFTLSRTDNVLSTSELNGDLAVQFLGYPKKITVRIGAKNPAA